jgi:hypothetical protein
MVKTSLIALLLLTGCASSGSQPAPRADYASLYDQVKDVRTREELDMRMMGVGGEMGSVNPAVVTCTRENLNDLFPARYHEAADRFVADRSRANWDSLVAVNNSIVIPDLSPKMRAIIDACKAKHGS